MHASSLERMRGFRHAYLDETARLTIADLGSMEVHGGSYKQVLDSPQWKYVGVDIEPGPNVDVVLANPYCWREFKDNSLDVIVTGQAFEHIEFFWLTFREMAAKLRKGGLVCAVAPSRGPEHRYPVDCWRFYPDGWRALAHWAGLELLEVNVSWNSEGWSDDSDDWGDCWAVFRKNNRTSSVRTLLARWLYGRLGRHF